MKRNLLLLLLAAIVALGGTAVQSQTPPPGPPPPSPDGPPGPKDDKFHGPKPNMIPPPVLIAGDPRFQEMLVIALAPSDQVKQKLAEWPDYQKADDEQKAKIEQHVEGMRSRIIRTALEEAERLGIKLPEGKKDAFVRAYWEKRMAVETPIRKEVDEKIKAAMENVRQQLKAEFQQASTPGTH